VSPITNDSTTAGNRAGFDNNIDGSVIAGEIRSYKGMYTWSLWALLSRQKFEGPTIRNHTSMFRRVICRRTEDALGKMLQYLVDAAKQKA